jgi:hypothetical protein
MALFMPGRSKCPICGFVLNDDDERFGTSGVFHVPPGLLQFCDAVMHWSCYADWPHRPEFAKAYFDFWVGNERHNQYWAKAYLDGRVFVTVNPFLGENGEVELVLAATGSRVRVQIEEWERWLDSPTTSEGRPLHRLVVEELRAAVPALKVAIPTEDAIVGALDIESKGWARGSGQGGEPKAAADGGRDPGSS